MIDGAFYRLKYNGKIGQLEAAPLHDRGDLPVSEDTGILWIPAFGDKADHWLYVKAEDIEFVHDEHNFQHVISRHGISVYECSCGEKKEEIYSP